MTDDDHALPAYQHAREYRLTDKGRQIVSYVMEQSIAGVKIEQIANELGLTVEHIQIIMIIDASCEERERQEPA